MGRVIVSMNLSIDGFMASHSGALDWQFNYWTSDMSCLLAQQLSQAGTILLGRNTYDAMAAYWPLAGNGLGLPREDIAYAALMNNRTKIVCSNTLQKAHWSNCTIFGGDVCSQIRNLKQQAKNDIIIYGSRTLVQHLILNKLIDELQLWYYPVALQTGLTLFDKQLQLKMSGTRQFVSGVVLLSYQCRY